MESLNLQVNRERTRFLEEDSALYGSFRRGQLRTLVEAEVSDLHDEIFVNKNRKIKF